MVHVVAEGGRGGEGSGALGALLHEVFVPGDLVGHESRSALEVFVAQVAGHITAVLVRQSVRMVHADVLDQCGVLRECVVTFAALLPLAHAVCGHVVLEALAVLHALLAHWTHEALTILLEEQVFLVLHLVEKDVFARATRVFLPFPLHALLHLVFRVLEAEVAGVAGAAKTHVCAILALDGHMHEQVVRAELRVRGELEGVVALAPGALEVKTLMFHLVLLQQVSGRKVLVTLATRESSL